MKADSSSSRSPLRTARTSRRFETVWVLKKSASVSSGSLQIKVVKGHKGRQPLLQASRHCQEEKKKAIELNGAEPHGWREEEGREGREKERERLITCSLLRLKADGFSLSSRAGGTEIRA